MHSHEAFDDLLEVFPLLLARIVVAVSVNLRWQVFKCYLHLWRLHGLNWDFFLRCLILDEYDAFIESRLRLADNICRLK